MSASGDIRDLRQPADEELAARYRESGDTALIGELFKRYTHLVLGLCMKYLKNESDARDMVMQIFEKLIVDLREHEVEHFKGWLYTVSRNACLMELRRRKTHLQKVEEYRQAERSGMENGQLSHPEYEGGIEGWIDGEAGGREARLDALEGALARLNDQQKTCIELFYLRKHSYQEVADATGYTLKQVKSYLQNGKRNLRIILSENGAPDGLPQ